MTSSRPDGRSGGGPGRAGGKKFKADYGSDAFVAGGGNEHVLGFSSVGKRVPCGLLMESMLRSPQCKNSTVTILKSALLHYQGMGGGGPMGAIVEPAYLAEGGASPCPPQKTKGKNSVFDMIQEHDPSIRDIEKTPDGISQPFWRAVCFAKRN